MTELATEEHRLYELMKEWAQKPGHKVLTCGAEVLTWFREVAPASRPDTFLQSLPSLYDLMAIVIQLAEDSPPKAWRLVLHDKCEVVFRTEGEQVAESTVRHGDCTIIAEGSIG